MEKTIERRSMGRLAAAAAVCVVGACVEQASAGLMIDLRATALNGFPLFPEEAKGTDRVFVGDVLTLRVWARVTGTNGINDEAFQGIQGVFQSGDRNTNSLEHLGNLINCTTLAPFNGSGSQNGSSVDIDSDGDLDVGIGPNTPSGSLNTTTLFFPRSVVPTSDDTIIDANSEEFLIGTVQWQMTDSQDTTLLNFLPRKNPDGTNGVAFGTWQEDGQLRNPTNSPVTSGAPVHISWVPEPAGLALALLAAASVIHRRRRGRRG